MVTVTLLFFSFFVLHFTDKDFFFYTNKDFLLNLYVWTWFTIMDIVSEQ